MGNKMCLPLFVTVVVVDSAEFIVSCREVSCNHGQWGVTSGLDKDMRQPKLPYLTKV